MPTVLEFLSEVDEFFGFYFDVRLACYVTRERMCKFQRDSRASDESPFIISDGPPVGTPEQEFESSLHATTIGAWKKRVANSGFDNQQAAATAVVFAYHVWEEKYRGKLADRETEDSDIMGDLRLLRNSIIHNKGIAGPEIYRCKIIKAFVPGSRIALSHEHVIQIIRAIRSEFTQKT